MSFPFTVTSFPLTILNKRKRMKSNNNIILKCMLLLVSHQHENDENPVYNMKILSNKLYNKYLLSLR